MGANLYIIFYLHTDLRIVRYGPALGKERRISNAAKTGAAFMKFGLASTTWKILVEPMMTND